MLRKPPLYLLTCLFALGTVSKPSLAAIDEKRLRHAIPYPFLDIGYSFGDGGNGLALGYPRSMNRSLLRQAQERLKKTGENGPLCLEIAKLYWDMGSISDGREYADKAVSSFTNDLVTKPDDPDILAAFAEAKCLTGDLQGGVTYVADLTKRIPDKWQLWVAESFVYRLAGYFYLSTRMKFARVTVSDDYEEQRSLAATKFPDADAMAFAEELFKTGAACCDRAVELAPERAAVYANRATFAVARDQILYLARPHTSNDPRSPFKIANAPSIIADYKYASDLDDSDEFAKIRLSYLNCLNILFNGNQLQFDKGQYWKNLEPNKQKIVQRETSNLLTVARDFKDKIIVAEAQSNLSVIYMMQGDYVQAKQCVLDAVTADPDRNLDWERLTELLLQSSDFKTLAAMTKKRLALADTMRNRILLTIACVESGDQKEALAQFTRLQADFGAEPKVHLLEIAMLLERTDTPNRKAVLARVGDLLNRYQGDNFTDKQDGESLTLLTGIYDAFVGKPAQAKAAFAHVAKADPSRWEVKEAIAALGEKANFSDF